MKNNKTVLDLLREQNISHWWTNKSTQGHNVKIPVWNLEQRTAIEKALKRVPELIKVEEYKATEYSRFGKYEYQALRIKLTNKPSLILL